MEKSSKNSEPKRRSISRNDNERHENESDALGSRVDEQCPIGESQTNKKARRNEGKRKMKVKKRTSVEKEDCLDSSHVSLPQIVPVEEEGDEKRHERIVQNESTFSLNRFSHLPPIPSDTNSVRAAAVGSTHSSNVARHRLPPIRKNQADEKPDLSRRRSESVSNRKRDKKIGAFHVGQLTEMKNKARLERHAKKRKEALEAWAVEQSIKIEKHLLKLDTAERNKENLRQMRKRKLECEEEKRRRAKERVSEKLISLKSEIHFL